MARHVRVALEGLRAGEQRITGAPARYLTRILRLRAGSVVTAFDPEARLEAEMTLVAADTNSVLARFAEPVAARIVGLTGVTLIQCAGKGDKVDEVVRAATALGASAIVIAQSERTVARGTPSSERRDRLRAIALDAARQSGRGDLPELRGPLPLSDVLTEMGAAPSLKLCLEPTAGTTLGAALAGRAGRELVLLVGPEGGFSPTERDAAERAGFMLVRLGALVLRTELAGAAALGAVLAAE
jgi:16S rRNA (uracil1498-N3)-methyltransferase